MNEFEAHESSYDHLHKKRLKEMKEMQTQVNRATNKSKEEKGPLVKIQLGGKTTGASEKAKSGGGFKKGGFKSAFGPVEDEELKKEVLDEQPMEVEVKTTEEEESSDMTDEEDYYDPRRPTGCMPDCRGRMQASVR
jgi:hypothetical protein